MVKAVTGAPRAQPPEQRPPEQEQIAEQIDRLVVGDLIDQRLRARRVEHQIVALRAREQRRHRRALELQVVGPRRRQLLIERSSRRR